MLYWHVVEQVIPVMQALDTLYQLGVTRHFMSSCTEAVPYGTTVLRSLYYPAGDQQVGAVPHLDRGFITAHLGDVGGQLLAYSGKDGAGEVVVSPKPGEMLLFWGVKILWVSGGKIQPLWHGSTVHADRFAQVLFGHVPIAEYQVKNALVANEDFYRDFLPRITTGAYRWDQ
jgi:hypothetical protein